MEDKEVVKLIFKIILIFVTATTMFWLIINMLNGSVSIRQCKFPLWASGLVMLLLFVILCLYAMLSINSELSKEEDYNKQIQQNKEDNNE